MAVRYKPIASSITRAYKSILLSAKQAIPFFVCSELGPLFPEDKYYYREINVLHTDVRVSNRKISR